MGAYPAYKRDYDAMVFIDGWDVVAISSDGSVIDHGTNWVDDSDVIQSAIDYVVAATSGGKISIGAGVFIIYTPILIKSYIQLYGDGTTTTLYAENGLDDNVIYIENQTNCLVENLWIVGNSAGQASGSGIYINHAASTDCFNVVKDVVITDCKEYGVEISSNSDYVSLLYNIIGGCGTAPVSDLTLTSVIRDTYGHTSIQSRRDYDAMVFIEGTSVIAVDGNGSVISRGVAGTDDTAVIQAAITTYLASNGGMVYISPGNYSVDDSIVLPADTHIVGAGDTTVITADGDSYGFSLGSRCSLKSLKILPNPVTHVGSTGAVYISGDDVVISNVRIDGLSSVDGFDDGIDSSVSANNIRIFECVIENLTGAAVYHTIGTHCVVDGCMFDSNVYGVVFTSPVSSATVSNCTISNSTTYGLYIQCSGNRFVNNHFESNAQDVYISANSNANIFANNYFSGTIRVEDNAIWNIYRDNIGYVDLSEIRQSMSEVLNILGSCKLLLPNVETSGMTVSDYSRNGHDGTASADVSGLFGFIGRATYYDLDSASSHTIDVGDHTDFTFGNGVSDDAFSVGIVLNHGLHSYPAGILSKFDDTGGAEQREWALDLDASQKLRFYTYDETNDDYIGRMYNGSALDTDTWHFIIGTYDGSTTSAGFNIYINGVAVDDQDYAGGGGYAAMEGTTAGVRIARYDTATGNYIDGKVIWTFITAKELDADEVWWLTQRIYGTMEM